MQHIKDHFLIGDLQTAALVGKNGAIDWLCLPYFDSPSVFASLLDEKKGGQFALQMDGFTATSRYIPYTAIVETTFATEQKKFVLRDFMLPRPTEEVVPHYLVRKLLGVKGSQTVRFQFDPRPNYARQRAVFTVEKEHLSIRIEDRTLWLHLPKGSRVRQLGQYDGVEIEVDLEEGEEKHLILEYGITSKYKLPDFEWEEETADFWKSWITEGNFSFSRQHLVRSAITLKLLQFYPTGGLIAAPTTSLPRAIGKGRNWDHRYVWIREATSHLYAFSVLGFTNEAQKFFTFIERVAEEAKRCDDEKCDLELSVLYNIWGQPLQGETELDHLDGHKDSKPVRIGNAAAEQFQLDVYGSLIDAYYFMHRRGIEISEPGKDIIRMLVAAIARSWKKPDSGMWEVRGKTENFAYSKMMAWLGIERALRLKDILGLSSETVTAWEKLRDSIAQWIWDNCYDEEQGTFVQHPDTSAQDATNFLFVLLFFLNRHDAKTAKIIEATQKALSGDSIFLYRYINDDKMKAGEGAFLPCMFWEIAALAAIGKADEADALMKQFEERMPNSGLLAEQIDPSTEEYLGNFPQAFSHIGYILGAYYIERYRTKTDRSVF